jgi:hypothetical protein
MFLKGENNYDFQRNYAIHLEDYCKGLLYFLWRNDDSLCGVLGSYCNLHVLRACLYGCFDYWQSLEISLGLLESPH